MTPRASPALAVRLRNRPKRLMSGPTVSRLRCPDFREAPQGEVRETPHGRNSKSLPPKHPGNRLGGTMNVEMHDFRTSLVLKFVQQPCSNPGKSPEMLRKATKHKSGYLREFCKFQKAPANRRTAFTRQRSLVRNQHRPLRSMLQREVRFNHPAASRDRRLVGCYGEAKRLLFRSVTASKSRIPERRRNPHCATIGVVRGFLPLRVWL